jgi:hypothetical protein
MLVRVYNKESKGQNDRGIVKLGARGRTLWFYEPSSLELPNVTPYQTRRGGTESVESVATSPPPLPPLSLSGM